MSVSLGVVVRWPADEVWTMCCGALSAFGSGSILLTVLLFPMMVRRKLFMHVIVMMSLTDFIASVFCTIGFPRNATLCAMQGVATTFGFLASWLWTTMLAYQLYYLVRKGRPKYTLIGMHCLVWGFTIVMFLIPLLLSVLYGLDAAYLGRCLCGFTGPPRNVAIWINVHFAVAVVCMALQVYFSVRVYVKFTLPLHRRRLRRLAAAAAAASFYPGGVAAHQASNPVHMQGQGGADGLRAAKQARARRQSVSSERVPVIASAVNILALYPAGFIFSWLPVSVLCFLISSGTYKYSYVTAEPDSVALSFFRGLGPLYGAFLAVCFYSRSSEARRRWYFFLLYHWVGMTRCSPSYSSSSSSGLPPYGRGRGEGQGQGRGQGRDADNRPAEGDDEDKYSNQGEAFPHQRDRAISATSRFAAQLRHHYRSSEIVNMLRDTYITQTDFQEDEEPAEGSGGAGGASWPRALTLSVAEGPDIDYGFEDEDEDEDMNQEEMGLGSQRAATAVGADMSPAPRLSTIDIELSRNVDHIPHH